MYKTLKENVNVSLQVHLKESQFNLHISKPEAGPGT